MATTINASTSSGLVSTADTSGVLQLQTAGTTVLNAELGKALALQGATSTTGCGIAFPATQVTSTDANTLDDYEEGTWTPTAVNVTGLTGTAGNYTKIGRVVYVQGRLITSTGISCTAGSGYLSGLPFTVTTIGGAGGSFTAITGVATGQIAATFGSGNIFLPTFASVGTQDFSVTYSV